jgi:hypothetical protein
MGGVTLTCNLMSPFDSTWSQSTEENSGEAFLSLLGGLSATWNSQGSNSDCCCSAGDGQDPGAVGEELVQDGLLLLRYGSELYQDGQQLIRNGDVADGRRLERLGEQLEGQGLGLVTEGLNLEICGAGWPGQWGPIDPLPVDPLPVDPLPIGTRHPIYQPV